MPRTARGKRPGGGLVQLAPGIAIPPDFTGSNKLVSGGTYAVRIVTDPVEREPRVASFTLTFDEPPTVSDLDDEQIRKLAGVEIAIASAQIALDQGGPAFLADLAEVEAVRESPDTTGADVLAATLRAIGERRQWHVEHAEAVKERLQRPRGRPERTDESKLEILDYWEDNGIAETVEQFGLAERTVRRYIADARKIKEER